MIFDSLTHATRDGSWLGGNRYDASIGRLLSSMDEAHVEHACLVAIADWVENESTLEFAKSHPDRLVPVGSINPGALSDASEAAEAIVRLRDQGFRGLKLHPRLNGYDPLDERCIAAVVEAGANGIPVLLDTLFRQKGVVTRHVTDVIDQLVHAAPETNIVLLHGGGPAMLELFDMVRMHSQLIIDLSFSLNRYAGSSLDQDIRFVCSQLDQRVCFGSDFPEYTTKEAIELIEPAIAGLSEVKRRNILHDNLHRLFFST